jgi:ADP-ribosylglycohydrolase
MLAGALYGIEAIPKRWLDSLDLEITAEIVSQTKGLLQGKDD